MIHLLTKIINTPGKKPTKTTTKTKTKTEFKGKTTLNIAAIFNSNKIKMKNKQQINTRFNNFIRKSHQISTNLSIYSET